MTAKTGTILHKASGKRYWFERRLQWGKIYHSMDGGETYHGSMHEAYKAAKASGRLHSADHEKEAQ